MERLLFLFLAVVISTSAVAGPEPQVPQVSDEIVQVSDVYIPTELKSNGDAYVVVNGMFPNSCYRFKQADVKNKSATEHEIRVIASVTKTMCLMVLVPFSKEVALGRLERGTHRLRFVNGDGTYFEREMNVP